jgi:hypothetical protein
MYWRQWAYILTCISAFVSIITDLTYSWFKISFMFLLILYQYRNFFIFTNKCSILFHLYEYASHLFDLYKYILDVFFGFFKLLKVLFQC